LNDYSYQKKVRPTALCGEIAQEAYALFCEHYALRIHAFGKEQCAAALYPHHTLVSR